MTAGTGARADRLETLSDAALDKAADGTIDINILSGNDRDYTASSPAGGSVGATGVVNVPLPHGGPHRYA